MADRYDGSTAQGSGSCVFAWEPRGAWPHDLIRRLCEELDLIHCVDPFKNEPLFGGLDYFRLHGAADYVYTYTDKELEILRKKISEKTTYVMFNNNTMKQDALRFLDILKS